MLSFISAADEAALEALSVETGLACDPDEDRAVQSDEPESNINVLAKRFGLDIDAPPPAETLAYYGDFTGITDLHTARQRLLDAEHAFMSLPARVRARFEHDPVNLLDFLQDAANADEAAELGLLSPEAVQRLQKAKKAPEEEPKTGPEEAPKEV